MTSWAVSAELAGHGGRWPLLILAGVVLLAGTVLASQDEGPFGHWVWRVIILATAAGPLVLLAAAGWRHERPGRGWLLLVILAGLTFRLAAAPASHELSDDAARYHWDGKVLAHGINPYLHAPDAAAVAHLRGDALDAKINHPWYRTCYPPLAELLFAVGYLLSPGKLTGYQALCLLAELVTWLLLIRELSRRARPPSWLLLAAWCPLIVYQGYLPGHLDVLTLPLVTLFILATAGGQARRAGIWLGLACLVKPLPLIFLPAALWQLGWRRGLQLLASLLAVGLLGYLPFLDAGWYLFSSTWLMATDWSFNGSLAALAEALLTLRTAHLLTAIVAGLLILAGAWRGTDLLARMLLAQAAFIACTPTLFPWYLIGMYPLLVLRPDPALLAIGVLAPLVDEVVVGHHLQGIWEPALWPRLVEYAAFYGLLLISARRGWGMFGRSGSDAAGRRGGLAGT